MFTRYVFGKGLTDNQQLGRPPSTYSPFDAGLFRESPLNPQVESKCSFPTSAHKGILVVVAFSCGAPLSRLRALDMEPKCIGLRVVSKSNSKSFYR